MQSRIIFSMEIHNWCKGGGGGGGEDTIFVKYIYIYTFSMYHFVPPWPVLANFQIWKHLDAPF